MIAEIRRLLPKQYEFVTAEEPRVLMSGAFGSAKSRGFCEKLVTRARFPGAREFMTRKHLVTLKATTLRTLLEPTGAMPPVLPAGTYTHNQTACQIHIHGGGEIDYFGMEEWAKIGSREFSGGGADQAEELTEADWMALEGRIRLQVPGLPRQLYSVCNPGPPSHFLARRFGLAGGSQAMPGHRAIVTATADNWHLPKDYVEALNTYTGLAYKRFVLGQWAGSDRLVYDTWDREKFVKVRPMPPGGWRRTIVGVDVGYTNPGALLLIHQDGDGRIHVAAERYEKKILPAEWKLRAREWFIAKGATAFAVDPSSPDVIADWNNDGLPATPANNERAEGVRIVRSHLTIAGDGLPRLTADPACAKTIEEFETWETMPPSKTDAGRGDEFTKDNDHAMDALRYGVMHLVAAQSAPSFKREPAFNPFAHRR